MTVFGKNHSLNYVRHFKHGFYNVYGTPLCKVNKYMCRQTMVTFNDLEKDLRLANMLMF